MVGITGRVMQGANDVKNWIQAIQTAANMATDVHGLDALRQLLNQLGPWIDAEKSAVGSGQHLPLVGGQMCIGENCGFDVVNRNCA